MKKILLIGIVGLLLATVGIDPMTGFSRFTFGYVQLLGGHHSPGGRSALPVVDLADLHQHGAVAMNLDERVDRVQFEVGIVGDGLALRLQREGGGESDGEEVAHV